MIETQIHKLQSVVSSAKKRYRLAEAAMQKLATHDKEEANATALAGEKAKLRGKASQESLEEAARQLAKVHVYVDNFRYPKMPAPEPKLRLTRKPENWLKAAQDLSAKMQLHRLRKKEKVKLLQPYHPPLNITWCTEADKASNQERAGRMEKWPKVALQPRWKQAVEEARQSTETTKLSKQRQLEIQELRLKLAEEQQKLAQVERQEQAQRLAALRRLQQRRLQAVQQAGSSFSYKIPVFRMPSRKPVYADRPNAPNMTEQQGPDEASFRKVYEHGMSGMRTNSTGLDDDDVRFEDQVRLFKDLLAAKLKLDSKK